MAEEKKTNLCLSCDRPVEDGLPFRLCLECQVLLRFALQKEKANVETALNYGDSTRRLMQEMVNDAKTSILGKSPEKLTCKGDENERTDIGQTDI